MTKKQLDDILMSDNFMDKITDYKSHVDIHTDKGLTDDLDRVILDREEAQSRFCNDIENTEDKQANKEHAEFLISEALLYHSGDILKWLKDAQNNSKFAFNTKFDTEDYGMVGTGIIYDRNNNTLKEYQTDTMRMVLRKDNTMPLGFALVTAYPDMKRQNIQPTGRNLTTYVKNTKAYAKADDIGKTYLIYRTDVNNNHLATYKASNTPDDSMMMLRVKTNNPNVYHEIKIKETGMTLRTVSNQYDDTGRTVKQTLETEYTKISEKKSGEKRKEKADLSNDKVFEKFAKDYPDVATSLQNIKEHFENKRTKNKQFDFNKSTTKTITKDRGKQANAKFENILNNITSEESYQY